MLDGHNRSDFLQQSSVVQILACSRDIDSIRRFFSVNRHFEYLCFLRVWLHFHFTERWIEWWQLECNRRGVSTDENRFSWFGALLDVWGLVEMIEREELWPILLRLPIIQESWENVNRVLLKNKKQINQWFLKKEWKKKSKNSLQPL